MPNASPTPFQQRVFDALEAVPPGCVITYGALARRVRCGSARAVGQALRQNRAAPRIPCHRVVQSDMRVGGYHGQTTPRAVRQKIQLLRGESIPIDADGRILDPDRIIR